MSIQCEWVPGLGHIYSLVAATGVCSKAAEMVEEVYEVHYESIVEVMC